MRVTAPGRTARAIAPGTITRIAAIGRTARTIVIRIAARAEQLGTVTRTSIRDTTARTIVLRTTTLGTVPPCATRAVGTGSGIPCVIDGLPVSAGSLPRGVGVPMAAVRLRSGLVARRGPIGGGRPLLVHDADIEARQGVPRPPRGACGRACRRRIGAVLDPGLPRKSGRAESCCGAAGFRSRSGHRSRMAEVARRFRPVRAGGRGVLRCGPPGVGAVFAVRRGALRHGRCGR